MFYKKFKPSDTLRPYIRSYYLWESNRPLSRPFDISSAANPNNAMVFNYGDPYQLYNPMHHGSQLPAQFFCSYSFAPYKLQLSGRIGMAGILFQAGAARLLFKLPNLGDLTDDRIDLTQLVDQHTSLVTEQLAEAKTTLQKIRILENFLLKRLKSINQGPGLADHAIHLIFQKRGMIAMDDLARQLYISPRQMRRIFKNELGINPKLCARLKRFNYVNLCLTQNSGSSWNMFLDKDAFYDQSHFIKDYQKFFGKNPTAQILENRKVAMELSS